MKKYTFFLLLCAVLLTSIGCNNTLPADEAPQTLISDPAQTSPDTGTLDPAGQQLKFSMEDHRDGNLGPGFWHMLQKLKSGERPIGKLNAFVFGDMVMHISFEKDTDAKAKTYQCLLTGLTVGEQSVTVNPPLLLDDSRTVSLFAAGSTYVFSSLLYSCGDTYIFHDGGIYEQHNGCDASGKESRYNDDIVVFSTGKDGTLRYECYPRKFTGLISVGQALTHLTARSEQFLERGSVTFAGGTPIFTKEESLTISQVWNLEAEFDAAKKCFLPNTRTCRPLMRSLRQMPQNTKLCLPSSKKFG